MSGEGTSAPRQAGTGLLTGTWLGLAALSLGSYALAEGGGESALLVLALVLAKLLLVAAVFMELAHRGRAWLLPVGGFLVVVVAALALALVA